MCTEKAYISDVDVNGEIVGCTCDGPECSGVGCKCLCHKVDPVKVDFTIGDIRGYHLVSDDVQWFLEESYRENDTYKRRQIGTYASEYEALSAALDLSVRRSGAHTLAQLIERVQNVEAVKARLRAQLRESESQSETVPTSAETLVSNLAAAVLEAIEEVRSEAREYAIAAVEHATQEVAHLRQEVMAYRAVAIMNDPLLNAIDPTGQLPISRALQFLKPAGFEDGTGVVDPTGDAAGSDATGEGNGWRAAIYAGGMIYAAQALAAKLEKRGDISEDIIGALRTADTEGTAELAVRWALSDLKGQVVDTQEDV